MTVSEVRCGAKWVETGAFGSVEPVSAVAFEADAGDWVSGLAVRVFLGGGDAVAVR